MPSQKHTKKSFGDFLSEYCRIVWRFHLQNFICIKIVQSILPVSYTIASGREKIDCTFCDRSTAGLYDHWLLCSVTGLIATHGFRVPAQRE